jgi:hypothetical protein
MSDSDKDNRSAASSNKSSSGNGPAKNKRFPQAPQGPRVQVGIEELKGFYYVYGRPDKAQVFRKTTEKIADHIVNYSREFFVLLHQPTQNYKSGKGIYRLITYGVETTYCTTRIQMTLERMQPQPTSKHMDYSSQLPERTGSSTTMTSSKPSGLSWGRVLPQ